MIFHAADSKGAQKLVRREVHATRLLLRNTWTGRTPSSPSTDPITRTLRRPRRRQLRRCASVMAGQPQRQGVVIRQTGGDKPRFRLGIVLILG